MWVSFWVWGWNRGRWEAEEHALHAKHPLMPRVLLQVPPRQPPRGPDVYQRPDGEPAGCHEGCGSDPKASGVDGPRTGAAKWGGSTCRRWGQGRLGADVVVLTPYPLGPGRCLLAVLYSCVWAVGLGGAGNVWGNAWVWAWPPRSRPGWPWLSCFNFLVVSTIKCMWSVVGFYMWCVLGHLLSLAALETPVCCPQL